MRPGHLLIFGAALLTISCEPKPPVWHTTFPAFGTRVEISIAAVSESRARRAGDKIKILFETLHRRWHPWDDGALASFNMQLMNTGSAAADDELVATVRQALSYKKLSGGRFDPAVAALVREWGFNEAKPISAPPDRERLLELLAAMPDQQQIAWQGNRLVSPAGGWAIDLGGFAKGLAIDRAIALLREDGIENAVINAVGDLRAIGRHNDRAWRIGIRHPRRAGVIAGIDISGDESVFTSGDYERFFVHEGVRYHHILDPETGYPVNGTMSLTVIGGNGGIADASATALFVAGPGAWPTLAEALGVELVMLVASDGHIEMTSAMANRVTLENPDEMKVVIVDMP
ncbi:MAG: FAD:protein FMN transferase [Gammaproteobacteria bacterium]|nr:FAD:protein FMN transferase [Gammaproteobacteria bacterium]